MEWIGPAASTRQSRSRPPCAGRCIAADELSIDGQVVARHAGGVEPLDESLPAKRGGPARPLRRPPATAPWTSSTTNPVTPSIITSGTDPRRKATTGVPHAIASIITRPNGSAQSIGNSRRRASPRNASLVGAADLADELDPGRRSKQRPISCS